MQDSQRIACASEGVVCQWLEVCEWLKEASLNEDGDELSYFAYILMTRC